MIFQRLKQCLLGISLKEAIWLGLYFFLLLPPTLVSSVHSGLDASWSLSINLAIKNNLIFGEDYIFTYGPLGFFLTKQTLYLNKWIVLLFELFIISCTIYGIAHYLRKVSYNLGACFIVLVSLFLLPQNSCEPLLRISYVFFIFIFLNNRNFIFLFAAFIISILSFYIKVNYGIIFIAILYLTLLIARIKNIITYIELLFWFAGHATTLIISSFFLKVNLIEYFHSSLPIINAYNDAMYVYISVSDTNFILGISIVVLFISGFILSYRYYLSNFLGMYFYALNALMLYLLFKNGYVRADGHILFYFENATITFSTLYLTIPKYKKVWAGLTCIVAIISLSVLYPIKPQQPFWFKDQWKEKIAVSEYYNDIVNDVSYKDSLPESIRSFYQVPSSFAQEIGHSSVDITPWEISEIYYYGLNYSPRPIPQSYSAYDEYLDRKNYEKYISTSAPEYVIFNCQTIDNRHPFWDESITKRALLTHYYLCPSDTSNKEKDGKEEFNEQYYITAYPDVKEAIKAGIFKSGFEHYSLFGKNESRFINKESEKIYMLFKKRAHPIKENVIRVKEDVIELGKEYHLNITENPQYLYADVQYNVEGKLRRLLFQPPALKVIFYYEDGSSDEFKAIVPILKTGVLINKKVKSYNDGALLFFQTKGKANINVTKIKFEGGEGFQKEIKFIIKEILFE